MKKMSIALLALATALATPPVAIANSFAYSAPAGQGTQEYSGFLANFFTVNSDLTINVLGVYNAAGNGVVGGSTYLQAFIYNVNQLNTLNFTAYTIFNPGEQYYESGNYIYQYCGGNITLTPGTYEIEAIGFDAGNPNGNIDDGSVAPTLNTFGGAITYLDGFSEYSPDRASDALAATEDENGNPAGSYGFPVQSNGGILDRWGGSIDVDAPAAYEAGSFGYITPEPSSLLLLGTGLLGLAFVVFRKAKATGTV